MMLTKKCCNSFKGMSQLSSVINCSKFILLNEFTISSAILMPTKIIVGKFHVSQDERKESYTKIREEFYKDLSSSRCAEAKVAMKRRICDFISDLFKCRDYDSEINIKADRCELTPEDLMMFLERPSTPLAKNVKDRLEKAGISEHQFCCSVVEVLNAINEPDFLHVGDGNYWRRDIIQILMHMNVNEVTFESMRILFSLKQNVEREVHGVWFF